MWGKRVGIDLHWFVSPYFFLSRVASTSFVCLIEFKWNWSHADILWTPSAEFSVQFWRNTVFTPLLSSSINVSQLYSPFSFRMFFIHTLLWSICVHFMFVSFPTGRYTSLQIVGHIVGHLLAYLVADDNMTDCWQIHVRQWHW